MAKPAEIIYTSRMTALTAAANILTRVKLGQICAHARRQTLDKFHAPFTAACDEFRIGTVGRLAAFVAQVAHESGEFTYVREIASGDAYEGRADLGNSQPGDGKRFRGRGLLQITGRANYIACGMALDLDLVEAPELLELPENACRSAAWFWYEHGLNALADAGDFERITRRINGGQNGAAQRRMYHQRALNVLTKG